MTVKSFVKDGKPVTQDREKIIEFFKENEDRNIYTVYLSEFDMRTSHDMTLESMKLYWKEIVLPQVADKMNTAETIKNPQLHIMSTSDYLVSCFAPLWFDSAVRLSIQSMNRVEFAKFLSAACTWAEKEYGLRLQVNVNN